MDEIYLEIAINPEEGSDTLEVSLETLIVFFTISYLNGSCISIKLVLKPGISVPFSIKIPDTDYRIVENSILPSAIKDCILPAMRVQSSTGFVCVAGLSAVLRQIVKNSLHVNPQQHSLLGFRDACLATCAETSLWTRFCEVDVPIATKDYISKLRHSESDYLVLPVDLARFERHMEQPLKIHNIQKKRQDHAKLVRNIQGDKISYLSDELANLKVVNEETVLGHRFSEGHSLTLADVMLFPCFYIIFKSAGFELLSDYVPLVSKWFKRMLNQRKIQDIVELIVMESIHPGITSCSLPHVPNQSLYKSDPRRYKPRARLFTRQEEIDASLKIISQMELDVDWSSIPLGADLEFDWSTVPADAHPLGGNLPESRLQRKVQQLENLAKAVLKIAKPGYVIVDFCSGSGHLGILLSHFLPLCHVVLLDNKDESLKRARDRVNRLSLQNISIFQCNLDYYIGKFDIGVSLHACGVATDLVIQRCLEQEAVFICCPCCYGGVQSNHAVSYPRSRYFQNSDITMRDYLILGHSADQTHDERNKKTDQGKLCMGIIDTDRCIQAREHGYEVYLSKLIPETCTPKNNLLVGLPGKICKNNLQFCED
ncbi:hypothetical protein J437_LFUL013518 [Ladona fulva]|uniref:GST C-terminal domain-containing protein n=1 Tax=Ladona fulva TaxID=123851 RepID=A0A8K0K8S4_LADFU|nr:hypothetical protein J437_LFUL013518 [Ladona fulva]